MIHETNQHTEKQPSTTHKNVCEQNSGCHQKDGSEHCNCNCAAYGRVCRNDARAAGKAACRRVQSILKDSRVFADGEPSFRRIQPTEITLGKRLGEGGFSLVHTCELKGADMTSKLAIKYLKRRVMVERKTFEYAASDLANEAFFLGRLKHPNIIQLYGITEGKFEDNISTGMDAGLFIVLDQLVETLDQRLERWRASANRLPHGIFARMSNAHKETQRKSLIERLETALDIAKVMHYLHSLDIIFRDLKPDNVGFDEKGILKLFDFGLAKELKDSAKTTDGKYRMSGHTGSRRYMSPEVAQDQPYNKEVDVYSFGILLWEMCSLEKPFAGYSSAKHMKDVIIGGERPKMDSNHVAHWPVDLQWIMKSSWSTDPDARPGFDVIVITLQNMLLELRDPKLDRVRTRSEGSSALVANDCVAVAHDSSSPAKMPFPKGRPLLKIPRLTSRS